MLEGTGTILAILIRYRSEDLAYIFLNNTSDYLKKSLIDNLIEDAEQLYEDFKKLKLVAQQEVKLWKT